MKIDVRQTLFDRGWVRCDRCVGWVMLPRWLAYRRGWHCGGVAGHYDYCPKCKAIQDRRQKIYNGKATDGTGCWAGEPGRPAVPCCNVPVGPSGLCGEHVRELLDADV